MSPVEEKALIAAREFGDDEARWHAVLRRDRRADGAFCYSVLTTGTYSRPSCGSRHARRANTIFFPDPAAAERAGFRPCRRCRPDRAWHDAHDIHVEAVLRSCRLMEAPGPAPSLGELAAATGFSRFHFHRVFTSLTGVTPKAYAVACRADRLRQAIPRTRTITEAIYEAGFNSSGNFYALAQHLLGMTPTAFKNSGRGVRIRYACAEYELGRLLIAATPTGICSVLFGTDTETLVRRLRARFAESGLSAAEPGLDRRLAVTLRGAAPLAGSHGIPWDIRRRALGEWLRSALNESNVSWAQTPTAQC
ncbi:helix-turn-helix domain-containing protein [Streptomyces sp. RB6PN25]|uniref:Helix-turn-helix domain-containing protein n=1 Tax=Streptomyces humicola TaxID=2953240 RepID=A0ABT1Q2Y8_9ACTN|nr:Ada metal-binding domain-containing protein [Streptomyces humicola]MCQ4084299.1 helix-turn-helix domain-containing protein [Streptomyces humicola]